MSTRIEPPPVSQRPETDEDAGGNPRGDGAIRRRSVAWLAAVHALYQLELNRE
jgi:hypothetical protein